MPTTGVSIAAENIASVEYQLVKLVGGQAGSTEPIPGGSTFGLVVDVSRIVGLSISVMPAVSGTVTVQGSVAVSGTAQVSGTVTVQGSIAVSGPAQVSGTVSVSGTQTVTGSVAFAGVDVTTTGIPAAASTGLIVALKPGAAVSISGAPVVQISGKPDVTTGTIVAAGATGLIVVLKTGAALATVLDLPYGTTAAPSLSATGVGVWIVGGQTATGIPVLASITSGAVVSVVPGLSVSAVVSGTVTITPTTFTVNTAATITGASVTIQQGASVSAVVSGTVSFAGVDVTTATSISASSTALAVVLKPGATIGTIVGTAVVSVVPGLSVTIQAGASVSAVVSGTVTVLTGGGLPGSTTGSSGMSGILVWLGASQTVLIGGQSVTIQQGASVSAVVSGTVTISPTTFTVNTAASVAGASITIQQGASVSLPGLSGVLASSVAATSNAFGLPVWIVGGQTGTGVSVLVTGNLGSIASILGTAIVSVVPGVSVTIQQGASVSAVVSGTVTAIPIDRTTATPSAAGTGAIVWVANPGAAVATTVLTVQTIIGTAVVSVVPGVSVTVQQGASVSAVVSGTVTVATGTVAALDVGRTNVVLVMPSTSVGISGTMMLFTAYQGITQSAAGTTGYVVPAGKTFRVLSVQVAGAQNSVTSSPVLHRAYVVASTAAPTWTTTVPIMAALGVQAVSATLAYSGCWVGIADIPAGATVGLGYTINTSGGSVAQVAIQGYLFP